MTWREGTPEDRGPELVGYNVKVWWDNEHGGEFYEGKVTSYDENQDMFQILYTTEPKVRYTLGPNP